MKPDFQDNVVVNCDHNMNMYHNYTDEVNSEVHSATVVSRSTNSSLPAPAVVLYVSDAVLAPTSRPLSNDIPSSNHSSYRMGVDTASCPAGTHSLAHPVRHPADNRESPFYINVPTSLMPPNVDVCASPSYMPTNQDPQGKSKDSPGQRDHYPTQSLTCRFCLEPVANPTYPCLCKGTTGGVHRSCLFRWMSTSGRTNCEICGGQFPPSLTTTVNVKNISSRQQWQHRHQHQLRAQQMLERVSAELDEVNNTNSRRCCRNKFLVASTYLAGIFLLFFCLVGALISSMSEDEASGERRQYHIVVSVAVLAMALLCGIGAAITSYCSREYVQSRSQGVRTYNAINHPIFIRQLPFYRE